MMRVAKWLITETYDVSWHFKRTNHLNNPVLTGIHSLDSYEDKYLNNPNALIHIKSMFLLRVN